MKNWILKSTMIIVGSSLMACTQTPKKTKSADEKTKAPEMANSLGQYQSFISAVNDLKEKDVQSLAAQFLEKNPADTLVLNGLAHFYRKTNRPKMAEILSLKVLSSDKENLRAKRNLAMIYLDQKKDSLALKSLREIHGVDKNFPGVAENIAAIYIKYEQYKPALAYLEQVYDRSGNDLGVTIAFGQALLATHQPEKSLAVLKKQIDLKSLNSTIQEKEGKSLFMTYLQVLENERGLIEREKTVLDRLAQQNGNGAWSEISQRVKDLL